MPAPQTGDRAPLFSLMGNDGKVHSLQDYRGRKVVLVFYPRDNTMVCTRQLCAYNGGLGALNGLNAVVLGISTQDLESHRKFAADHGLKMPLLADPGGAVAAAYGVLKFVGTAKRAIFIVNEEGFVQYRHVEISSVFYRGVNELIEALGAP